MSERSISLDSTIPLALLPVRIEARYLPRKKPTHLHVRIFPDVIHADAHKRSLSAREARIGKQYWQSIWSQTDAAAVSEAHRWLAGQVGPYRALWVSTTTRPSNLDSGDAQPVFPDLIIKEGSEAIVARLLPDGWIVRLYDKNLQLVHTAFSGRLPDQLPMAPTLSPQGSEGKHPVTGKTLSGPEGFLQGQGLLWTIDFEEAERVGMGLRIPIKNVPDPVGALLVLGLRAGRDAQAEGDQFDALLEAHWYTRGLDLVPQGTPTNNTDAGRSGVSLSSPDVDELFERESHQRPLAPLGRAALIAANAALLYRVPAADAASLAFGRIGANVLDRTAHAERNEGLVAWAMNTVLGYATIGRYLSGPLAKLDGTTALGAEASTLRDWYANWVRGAGPLPILRCGDQPYGLLPITARLVEDPGALGFEARLHHYLAKLFATWQASLPAPTLDPDATDGRPSSTAAADALTVAEVLGAVPHPTQLRLRLASDHLADDMRIFDELIARLEGEIRRDDIVAGDQQSLINEFWENRKQYIIGIPDANPPVPPLNIVAQLVHLDLYRQEVGIAEDQAQYETRAEPIRGIIDDFLQPLMQMHADAAAAVPSVLWDWHENGGLGSDKVIRLTGSTFDEATEDVLDLVTSSGEIEEIRELMVRADGLLENAFQNNTPPLQRVELIKSMAPLLAHLINITCRTVPTAEVGPVRLGLQVLLTMIDAVASSDAHSELERLLRETLGLAMHRLDAWVTSVAAQRLAKKRRNHGAGLQIGAYGWLLDLKRSDDPASQGFIHAPSLTHAATAAVLRAGWSAYGTRSGEAPLSIDLSSERVRGGLWILDGVRSGQDLAELLGARFERSLHDAHLDDWIRTVRVHALSAKGSTQPPNAVVDGLLVARAWSHMDRSDREDALHAALELALAPTTDPTENSKRDGVRRALKKIAADLDSAADLALAQSVHSILQGNADAAAAMIALTGGSDAAVPPVTVVNSQRDAQLITHRVVAMWRADNAGDSPVTALHMAEPRLMAWIEALLPPTDRVVANVLMRDGEGAVIATNKFKVKALGLSSVELALLTGAGAKQTHSRLGRLLQAAVRTTVSVDADVDLSAAGSLGDKEVSVDEFGLIATALRDALGRSRDLRAEDLLMPGSEAPASSIDVTELENRITLVKGVLRQLISQLSSQESPQRYLALARSAALGVTGAVAAIEAAAPADAAEAIEAIDKVIASLRARLAEETPVNAASADSGRAAVDRLRRLTGNTIPILPVFTPLSDAARVASANSKARQRQVLTDGHRWLRQAGRVHAALGAMNDSLLLCESARGLPSAALGLAQIPETGGGWAAVTKPAASGDHCCIFSLTGNQPLGLDNIPIAGLLIDSWTEGIPKTEQQTGIAVHFDAPTARPPQAILLSTVEDGSEFSVDELCDQLLHTIELAKFRAVGADCISEIGHYLPAVFLPDTATITGGKR